MLQVAQGATLNFVGVTSDPSTIQNTNSNLILYGTLLTQIPSGGSMQITAPNEVTINSGALSCSFAIPSNGKISSCTASGRTITIIVSGAIPADAFEVHVLSVMTNPTSTTPTSSFSLQTFSTTSQLLDQLTTGINLIATQGLMQSQSLTPSSQVVGATTNLEVRFKPTHSIPVGSIIQVTFPKWNPAASSPQDYFQGGISCSTVAVLSASLQCAFANQVLTVTGAFSAQVTGGIEVAFSVTSFRNPISTDTITGFSILTTDSVGGNIDGGSPTVKVSLPAAITGGSISVDSSVSSDVAGIVQETNKLRLTFNSPVPLNQNCVIKVNLPPQFSVSTISSVLVSGLFGVQTSMNPTKTTTDNSFTFTQCTSYTSNTLAANIVIDSLKLPNYNKPTASFSITISASTGSIIAQVTSGITFTANPGTISSIATTATVPIILAQTGIIFTIQPKHTLDLTTKATIQLPLTYVLGSSCTITAVFNVNPASSCSFSSQTITINNLLNTTYIGGSNSTIQFQINSIQLPQTNQTANGLIVQLLEQDSVDSNFYTVDTYSGSVPLQFGYGSFSRVVVNPGSLNAYAVTIYNIEFTPNHYIPQNGYIQITYPPEVTIPDPSYSQSSCTNFSSTFSSAPSCVITSSTSTIQINNGFRTSTTQPGGTKYSFNIPGIQNPIQLGQSSTFKIQTVTSSGIIMDYQNSGIFVTMTQTALMKIVAITMGSYVNAAITSYTFTITASVPITEDNYVIIQFPSQIVLPSSDSSLACQIYDTSIFNSVTCQLNTLQLSNSIKVLLDLKASVTQINILQTFIITVNGIKNPTSTQETSDFVLQITDKSFKPINQSPAGLSISTNTPYTLTKSSLTQNTTGAGQQAQYNITIYPENDIDVGGGIYLVYPSEVTNSTAIQVTVISPYTKATPTVDVTISARQIVITDAFQLKVVGSTTGDQILIVLDGFRNPLVNNITTSFQVKTFNEAIVNSQLQFYYIDQVLNGLVLNSPCDYPCALCQSSNPSNCTSCYSTAALNKLQGGTCVAECSVGKFYNTKTSQCEPCSFPCLGCSQSATNCTVCGLQDYLYLLNNQCVQDCTSGYVEDSKNNVCAKCNSECSTCDLTPATCTSCSSSTGYPYLYQSTCLKTCPSSLTITTPGKCQNCDPMCKTCSGTTTNCTSCYSYMRFDPSQDQCLAACTPDTQIYNQTTSQCLNCDDSCLTCSGNTTTCTSCRDGSVLNIDSTCKSSCNAIDQVAVNNVCKQCELPCSQCKINVNHCTKCQGDYLLFNTTCVQYCPEKYEPNNSTGQCILVGLICPSGFTVNEAGDGCIPNEFECPEGYQINSQRTACVPKPGSAVPFPFLIFSIILCLLVLGSYIKDKFFTKIYTNIIALLSFQEILMYLLMVAYAGANEIWGAFALSLIALLMLMTANIIFYLYYKRDIMQDDIFAKWQRSYPKTSKYIPLICLFVNFKCIRLFYSGFYGLESCLAQFEDPMKNLFRPLKMITYFNYIFIYIPIIVADIIVFAQVKWGYQLLVLAIETFLLTIAIVVLTYLEMRHPERLIIKGDEQYSRIKPKYFNGESMVMAGMIDVDESTLIRTKVVDDDYEIFLRKKAFVSILKQVEKNYSNAQQKGIDLGGKIDQVMSKFDEKRLKLRRAFSLEEIKEDESWYIPSDGENNDAQEENGKTRNPLYTNEQADDLDDLMGEGRRRYSYPLTPKSRQTVPDPQFKQNLNDIKQAQATTKDRLENNVYAECKAPDKNKEKNRRKTVSRRTQTYLRELLQLEGEDLHESDLEIVMEDDAEIDVDYTKDLIDGVIDGISESESNVGGGKKRAKKKRKNLNTKRTKEIPDFELADIMGDFEIDDLGNFIILRGEKGELLDKKERRVNRRGYLIDRFGNIINKQGQVIFKAVELDSDDEIPAPFGFEKRKKNLLNLGQDGEFKIQGGDKEIEDDEDLIDKELRMMKKTAKKKTKRNDNGQIVEEEDDNEDDESSVDSLMAESPGKYQLDQLGDNEDEIIANVTKKKVPVKRHLQKGMGKKQLKAANDLSPQESQRKKTGPLQNLPPKRIKKDDTKDMFPSLTIEASEQKKLFKIAEQIGGMANQIAEGQKKNLNQSQISNQEILDQLKQEHFKDLMQENQKSKQAQTIDKKLPPKPNMDKIYGNLGDVVNYEEQLLKEQYKGIRAQSPFSSQMTTRMGFRPETSTIGTTDKRRLKGLESIYLQKFDKKAGLPQPKKQLQKAKFRNTLMQFVDDPDMLVDDGIDKIREREMSLQVADKLDRLQKQYMSNTTTHNFKNIASVSSTGFQPTVGAAVIRKNGSLNGSMFNQDPSLEPIKKGNWIERN